MHEELRALLPMLQGAERETLAGREFHQGLIHCRPVDADAPLAIALAAAAERCLLGAGHPIGAAKLAEIGIDRPRLHCGLVASGDRFVSSHAESAALRAALPDALAVEMEGAALAQVCTDFGRPFAVLRTISDRGDDSAHGEFTRFIADVASVYTRVIVANWLAGPGHA